MALKSVAHKSHTFGGPYNSDAELKEQMQEARQMDQEIKEQLAKIGFEI